MMKKSQPLVLHQTMFKFWETLPFMHILASSAIELCKAGTQLKNFFEIHRKNIMPPIQISMEKIQRVF